MRAYINGHKLRLLRNSKKLTQGQLAIKAGVAVGIIGSIETFYKEYSRPCLLKLSHIIKLANALEISQKQLIIDNQFDRDMAEAIDADIVKICPKHGALTRKDAHISNKKHFNCAKCHSLYKKDFRIKNRETLLKREAELRKKNIDRIRETQKRFLEKHKEKIMAFNRSPKRREELRKMEKEKREQLSSSYLKKMIIRGSILKHKDIPESLVEMKRVIVLIKRQIKQEEHSKK